MGNWTAACVEGDTVTVWQVQDGSASNRAVIPLDALGDYAAKRSDPIVTCGLSGPARPVPCKPIETTCASRIAPTIAAIPALAQHNPAALSGGLETVVAGYMAINPDFDGVICAQGLQTLWAQISAGEVVSFQTFVTPDLMAALSGSTSPTDGFAEAVADTLSHPDRLARHLSSARTLNAPEDVTGHLIGAELAAAKPYWLGQRLVLIGHLSPLYERALHIQGVPVETAPWESTILNGLKLGYAAATAPPPETQN